MARAAQFVLAICRGDAVAIYPLWPLWCHSQGSGLPARSPAGQLRLFYVAGASLLL